MDIAIPGEPRLVKRILVTGAGGFIGRPVAEILSRAGHEVHAIQRADSPSRLPPGVTGHRGDLLDAADVRRVLAEARPQALIHLAWITEHSRYWDDPSNFRWLDASVGLFRDFLDAGGESCLAAGTSAEYDWSSAGPLDEERSAMQPRMRYGEYKYATFLEGEELFARQGQPFAWARFFCPFGPGEDARRLIPKTCLRLLRGERISFDAASQVRDFLHVEDAAGAVAALAQSSVSGPVNIASGEPRSVRAVVEEIAKCLGAEDRVEFGDAAPPADEPQSISASIGRLRSLTNWRPAATFSERIAQACEWWKALPPADIP